MIGSEALDGQRVNVGQHVDQVHWIYSNWNEFERHAEVEN